MQEPRHCIYILRDDAGQVLYVGQSLNVAQRLSNHKRSQSWWPEVEAIEIQHCETKADMDALEMRLISELWPLHNVRGNPLLTPEDPYARLCDCEWPPAPMYWMDGDDTSWRLDGNVLTVGHWWCDRCEDMDTSKPSPDAMSIEIPHALANQMREDEKRRAAAAVDRMAAAARQH